MTSACGLDGTLYFNSNRSILIYDSVRWRQVYTPTPRQLAVDASGRVWVGSDGDLGYLELEGKEVRLTSLRDRLPKADHPTGRTHGIAAVDGQVYFLYTRQLLRWSEKASEVWRVESGLEFEAMVARDGEVYVFQKGRGLLSWPREAGSRGPGAEVKGQVRTILPLSSGGFLLGTIEGGLWRLEDDLLETFSEEAEALIAGRPVWHLATLNDGRISIATGGSGLLILTAGGKVDARLTEAEGLLGNDVHTVTQDPQGALWLGVTSGVMRMSSVPITFYHYAPASPTSLLKLSRHGGDLYIGGVEGGYRLKPGAGLEPARFERVLGFDHPVGSWASTPFGLLMASREGLFRVEGLQLIRVAERGQTILWKSEEGVALSSADDLLRVLVPVPAEVSGRSPRSGELGFRFIDHPGVLRETVSEIHEGGPGVAWLVTRGTRTIYHLSFPEGFEAPPRLELFEMAKPWPELFWIDGERRIVDRDHVFRYEEGRLVVDERFPIGDWKRPGFERLEMRALGNGELWLTMRDRVRKLERQADGSFALGEHALGLSAQLNFDTHADPAEPHVMWMATELGPARFDTRFEVPSEALPSIRFVPPKTPREGVAQPTLDHSAGAFRFECSVPYYVEESLNEYRYRLVGLSGTWSDWTKEPVKEYTNLLGRPYRFEVEARHAGRLLGKRTFEFRVLPPWHQTWWARSLFLLVITGLVGLYTRVQKEKVKRERRIAERERVAYRRLQAVDKLKDEFLANTSHELRTPLFGMTGIAESLVDGSRGELPEMVRADLSMLIASGRRLSSLVDDVLDFSKLKHKSLELYRRPVDLRALCGVVLTLMRPLVREKDLRLKNKVPAGFPAVWADENRLQQILLNLAGNAVKFTSSGTVEISARSEDERVEVRVTDTGIGISERDQERIFDAFEQAEGAMDREFGGTGLGLAISRQLVELHGGELGLESTLGEGATFFFSLPISQERAEGPASSMPILTPEEAIASPESDDPLRLPGAQTGTEGSEKPLILVVDDEPVNRHVLANHLISQSFRVLEAANGVEALQHLEETQPDLVLLDVMMPKMSGYEACKKIRYTRSLEELPVVFLTARSQVSDLEAGYSMGANDFLAKPVAKAELLSRVDTHLKLLDAHRHLERKVKERTAQIKILKGLLPICSTCKKIRDDQGYWNQLEVYIDEHSEAEFSHSLCPDCFERAYGELGVDK